MKKPVTFTIPEQLDAVLHTRIARGQMSKFVTQALWEALKKDEETLLMEFLEADKDLGNIEVQQDFSKMEGEDFIGIDDFTTKRKRK